MIKVYSKNKLMNEFKDINILFNYKNKCIDLYRIKEYNYYSNTLEVEEITNDKNNIIELLSLKDNRVNIFIDNILVIDKAQIKEEHYKQSKVDIIKDNNSKLPNYNIYFNIYLKIN